MCKDIKAIGRCVVPTIFQKTEINIPWLLDEVLLVVMQWVDTSNVLADGVVYSGIPGAPATLGIVRAPDGLYTVI